MAHVALDQRSDAVACGAGSKLLLEVALHVDSDEDVLHEFIYECLLESFPQLALQLVYALYVTETGLDQLQVVNMIVTCSVLLVRLVQVSRAGRRLRLGEAPSPVAAKSIELNVLPMEAKSDLERGKPCSCLLLTS